jgi:hypothetical protein
MRATIWQALYGEDLMGLMARARTKVDPLWAEYSDVPEGGLGAAVRVLEVRVPDAPFPRVNDSEAFGGMLIDGALEAIQHYRAT